MIGGFTGLRTAELERLDWTEVHFDSDLVEVKAANSKTASRRFVPIRPALKEWLASYEGRKGKVAPKALRKRLERDRKLANIEQWASTFVRKLPRCGVSGRRDACVGAWSSRPETNLCALPRAGPARGRP